MNQPTPDKPNPLARTWHAVRDFVSALFGPDQASDDRTTRQGQVPPIIERRGGRM